MEVMPKSWLKARLLFYSNVAGPGSVFHTLPFQRSKRLRVVPDPRIVRPQTNCPNIIVRRSRHAE
jgi:hypothetical protein